MYLSFTLLRSVGKFIMSQLQLWDMLTDYFDKRIAHFTKCQSHFHSNWTKAGLPNQTKRATGEGP